MTLMRCQGDPSCSLGSCHPVSSTIHSYYSRSEQRLWHVRMEGVASLFGLCLVEPVVAAKDYRVNTTLSLDILTGGSDVPGE